MDSNHILVEFKASSVTAKQALDGLRPLVIQRFNMIKQIYESVAKAHPGFAKDIDITIPFCFSDKSDIPLTDNPALVFSKESYSNNILIPSLDQLLGTTDRNMAQIDREDHSFEDKSSLACFAGSLTNIYWNNRGIRNNDRLKVGELAAKNQQKINCAISMPPGFDPEEWAEVEGRIEEVFPTLFNSDFFNPHAKLSIADQLEYKYLICADGHTSAWARLPWQMYANAVPIKIRNRYDDFIEWFYPYLNKSFHLIETDIDNLLTTIQYLEENPEYAERVAAAGRGFVERFCTQEAGIRYFFSTLLELTKERQ